MSTKTFIAYNAVPPTTASPIAVATGTSIKTLLQVAVPSTMDISVIEWGISFDGSAAATPLEAELLQTDVAATGGTSVTPTLWGDGNGPASLCAGGAALTCHSPSGEGSITAVRELDVQFLPPTAPYFKQFPLGREPRVPVSKVLRVRVKAAVTVNAICYIIWEE